MNAPNNGGAQTARFNQKLAQLLAMAMFVLLLSRRRRGDDPGPESAPDHHLLGPDRRPGRLAAPSAMPSLIHGNFEGDAQLRVYALRRRLGSRSRRASARRLPHHVPVLARCLFARALIIAIVLSVIKRVKDAPYTGPRELDIFGSVLSIVGMGGIVLGILVWQEGGEAVGALLAVGAVGLGGLLYWLVQRKRRDKPTLLDPDLFQSKTYVRGRHARRKEVGNAAPGQPHPVRLPAPARAFGGAGADRAARGLRLVAPDPADHFRIRLGAAGIPAEQLHPVPDFGRAGQRGRQRVLGLGVVRVVLGLAFAGGIMRASLSTIFIGMATSSTVLAPDQQQQVSQALEEDAHVMSDAQLQQQLAGQPEDIQNEIKRRYGMNSLGSRILVRLTESSVLVAADRNLGANGCHLRRQLLGFHRDPPFAVIRHTHGPLNCTAHFG